MGSALIRGLGCSVPQGTIKQSDCADFALTVSRADPMLARRIKALYRRTGIVERGSVLVNRELRNEPGSQTFYKPPTRNGDLGPTTAQRMVLYAHEAPKLALSAAERALNNSRISPEQITHIITVSCTGFYSPGIEHDLICQLGLSPNTERIHIGFMGCHASINALRVAKGLVSEDPRSCILICCIELCSLHYQYDLSTDHIVSNALFADGAAAAIITGNDADSPRQDGAVNKEKIGTLIDTASHLVSHSSDAMTWKIGDNGFSMTLSPSVPKLIEDHLGGFLRTWMSRRHLNLDEIKGWAIHPGGSRIVDSVQHSLQLNDEALRISRTILENHGNMSSATLLFILNMLEKEGTPKPWLMLGFGPGLEIEVALIE